MRNEKRLVKKIRFWTMFYILSLVVWGVTAFPLEWELNIVCQLLNITPQASPEIYTGLRKWFAFVYQGVSETNMSYPFLAYGTDWLAFSHLVIAVAFVGVYFKPVRNVWVVQWGMIACIGVIPLALIFGYIREIPFYWRLIDCSFGVLGFIPLWLLRYYIRELQVLARIPDFKY